MIVSVRGYGLTAMGTVALVLLMSPAASALDRCRARPAPDGTIQVSATNVTGTPRWGTRWGMESTAFYDVEGCLSSGTMRNCPLAPPGAPERTEAPAACAVYLRDDGENRCAAWVKGCQPSSEPLPCSILPPDNIWNRDVSALPVHPMSTTWIQAIGADEPLKPDFGAGLYHRRAIGMPYVVIGPAQPLVPITFRYASESDPGPYPIPPLVPIEGGGIRPSRGKGDAHILLVQAETCLLWEIFAARSLQRGALWQGGSGAAFDLASNALRPDGWTSADAAGLPILPGLIRYDEVLAGAIMHAVRFTAPMTQRAYVWPARHYASASTDPNLPPMGIRVRLRASFDISSFSPRNRTILTALQRYGMMLADNGAAWFVSGAPDRRWDNEELRELRRVRGSDFEVVDVSSLMLDPDSGATRP